MKKLFFILDPFLTKKQQLKKHQIFSTIALTFCIRTPTVVFRGKSKSNHCAADQLEETHGYLSLGSCPIMPFAVNDWGDLPFHVFRPACWHRSVWLSSCPATGPKPKAASVLLKTLSLRITLLECVRLSRDVCVFIACVDVLTCS